MRYILLIVSSTVFNMAVGQTEEHERKYLNDLVKEASSEQISVIQQTELRELGKAWNQLMKDFGGYPSLPYNETTNEIEFSYILDLPGIDQQIILRRIKEWIAINFASISNALHYEDAEQGKLITKGWRPLTIRTIGPRNFWGIPKGETIDALKCFFTAIYTVKEGKVKVEYRSIEFESRYFSILSNTYRTTKQHISELYPVTAADKDSWKSRLSTLQETNRAMALSVAVQEYYIKEYVNDYQF
ncbi:MAG: DUF4468 domain-containing protein [Saprospiraceae bacterium]|nr:DUF4468 domain-containing protein [Saprospiraceae bacterium]